jgi:hypothetical protein
MRQSRAASGIVEAAAMSFKFLTTDDGAFYAVQETGELL